MKVTIEQQDKIIFFKLEPEKSDTEHLQTSNVKLAEKTTFVDLGGINFEDIHPDFIALASILMCHPFIGKELTLPVRVSEYFFNESNKVLSKYKIKSEIDYELMRYSPPKRSRPGLAFSGGADSTAALSLMPGNTIPIFMNRPMKRWSIYDSDAPLASCDLLGEIGFDVQIIDCDVEYLRKPVGFPSDLAHAIPSILLAENLGLDSIAFGTVMESAYGIGHENYKDYPNGAHRRFYGSLFKAAGIDLFLPVCGISEVGTSIINHKSTLGEYAQSCIRGKSGFPCLKCWKCFRKGMLSNALFGSEFEIEAIMKKNKEVKSKLLSYPISHENVLIYSIQRIQVGDSNYIEKLRDRLDTELDMSFLERWYSPSLELVPEKYRIGVKEKISEFLKVMNSSDENILKNWNMEEFLLRETTKIAHKDLKALF